MNPLQDRRALMAAGALAALLAGALIAAVLVRGRHAPVDQANVAASGGALQVQLGEQAKIDPNRELRCFVGGQFIGTATLADCAKKNGVAAQALDVGLDQSGALAAGENVSAPVPPAAVIPPAPTPPPPPPEPPTGAPGAAAAGGPTGECLRFGPEGWRAAGAGAVTLSACVQALYAGRCVAPGEAAYGRWSGQTLRLVPGRVETSPDNRDFRPLAAQGRDCSIPQL